MTADIVESADYSIAIANEENAFTKDVNETVVTLALQSVESTGTKPLRQAMLLLVVVYRKSPYAVAYSTSTVANMQYNVIMIGAGHNGLTAAAYLAKAGRKVLMLERREIVGGCAVTEEIDPELAPGCRVSTAAYIASMLRPTIIKDLIAGIGVN